MVRVGKYNLGTRAGKCKVSVTINTSWGPGQVDTNWGSGPVNTNFGPVLVNTNWGP